MQEPGRIWANLNARADLTQFRRLLEHLHRKPGSQQGESRGEAADASANDDHLHPCVLLMTGESPMKDSLSSGKLKLREAVPLRRLIVRAPARSACLGLTPCAIGLAAQRTHACSGC